MSLLTATTVLDWMYRGTSYTVKFGVKDNSGNTYSFTGEEEVKGRLSYTHSDLIVEKSGTIDSVGGDSCYIQFAGSDTAELPVGAYDLTLLIDGWPVLITRFGIVGYGEGAS